jgi:hypothetical protein
MHSSSFEPESFEKGILVSPGDVETSVYKRLCYAVTSNEKFFVAPIIRLVSPA